MDAVIIDQPDSDLLASFGCRVCEEVTELDMFRSAEKLIIQEKSQRLGEGKKYTVADSKTKTEYFEIKQGKLSKTIHEKESVPNLTLWLLQQAFTIHNKIMGSFKSLKGLITFLDESVK